MNSACSIETSIYEPHCFGKNNVRWRLKYSSIKKSLFSLLIKGNGYIQTCVFLTAKFA